MLVEARVLDVDQGLLHDRRRSGPAATGVRLFVVELGDQRAVGGQHRVLPAGVWSVSSTGSASSSVAEFRATRPVPPTHGQQQAGDAAHPATTIVSGELGDQTKRHRTSQRSPTSRAEDTRPPGATRAARLSLRRAAAGPGVRGVPVRRVRVRAGQRLGHHPQPVQVVHVAGGGRHGADGDLRVGAGEPVGQVLLAGGHRHPLGVHPQRRRGELRALGRRPRRPPRPPPSARVADSAVVAGGWVRLSTSPASGMPSAESRSTK